MKQLLTKITPVLPAYLFLLGTMIIITLYSVSQLPWSPSFPYYHDIIQYGRPLASLAHFDGIHYLRLIDHGYDDTGSQAFFPLYPMLVRVLSLGYFDPLYVGVTLNILLLLGSLYLVSLSMSKIAFTRFSWLYLTFPASFFLVTLYTESLFVFLVVSFFALLSRGHYGWAALIAGLASATRLVGVFLAISLCIELWQKGKLWSLRSLTLISVALSGLVAYLVFLSNRYGDPLMFIHVQSMFNTGRSDGEIILLPQVLYRYARILLSVDPATILYSRSLLELLIFLLSLLGLWLYRKRMTLPALVFCLGAILFPSLSGTLSSFPRYSIAAVPLYMAIASGITPPYYRLLVVIQYGILVGSIALFVQGIFIA